MKKKLRIIAALMCAAMVFALLPAEALADDGGVNAVLGNRTVVLNGETVQVQSYSIDGDSYLAIRDVAELLKDTECSFSISVDSANSVIDVSRGGAYTSVGTELIAGSDQASTCVSSGWKLHIDGINISTDAYNIGGSNYYKLQALGSALGFDVDCSDDGDTVVVSTVPAERGTATIEEAYASRVPASMGGPNVDDGDYVVFRWLGNSCWEINYRGQIILIDNFYDRGDRAPDTGVSASDIKYADIIIITHGHKDHMSDTAQVALQTGAPIYAHQTVITELIAQGVPEEQLHAFTDDEINAIDFPFDGMEITMVHTYHNYGGKDSSGFKPAITAYTDPSEETLAEEEEIDARGASDFSIMDVGLFAPYIEFDSGFSFFGVESNARGYAPGIAQFLEELDNTVDVFAAPMQLGYDPVSDIYDKKVVELTEILTPRLVLPQHHDVYPDFPMTSVLTMAQYVYDNMSDTTDFYLQMYREPLCFDTSDRSGGPLSPLSF